MLKIKILFIIFFFQTPLYSVENYFLMLKNNTVNVRYGPSFEYPIKFIYKKKNLPLKIIDKKENFRRIIDHKKNSGWIHISQLKKANSVIVLSDQVMFDKSSKFSEPIVKIQKGRLLIIKKCKKNWCKIQTSNYVGWIKTENIWGTIN